MATPPSHPALPPAPEELVTVEPGVRLFCRTAGSGRDTVVIPHASYLIHHFAPIARGRTAIFLDWRNRGYSDSLSDPLLLQRGILHDVDDLDRVRLHYGLDRLSLVTHSYSGLSALLYAMHHPQRVERLVLIAPPGPSASHVYPPHLTCNDDVAAGFRQSYAELLSQRHAMDPELYCRRAWSLLCILFAASPEGAARLGWEPCGIPNERAFMPHWTTNILPSIQALCFPPETRSRLHAPALFIHGRKDRSAPYGAGCEWAATLPNARLLTIENAAHVPWIEAPQLVFSSIDRFLRGDWPEHARPVHASWQDDPNS